MQSTTEYKYKETIVSEVTNVIKGYLGNKTVNQHVILEHIGLQMLKIQLLLRR